MLFYFVRFRVKILNMKMLFTTSTALMFLIWSLSTLTTLANEFSWRPCPELSSSLQFPCRCRVEPFTLKPQVGAVSVDCDYVVFQTESPILPTGAPIISYSQRYSGQQLLPTQVNVILRSIFSQLFHYNVEIGCLGLQRPKHVGSKRLHDLSFILFLLWCFCRGKKLFLQQLLSMKFNAVVQDIDNMNYSWIETLLSISEY